MEGVGEIQALVIAPLPSRVRSNALRVEHGIAGIGREACRLEQEAKWNAGPLADGAPSFHRIMARDLRAGRKESSSARDRPAADASARRC